MVVTGWTFWENEKYTDIPDKLFDDATIAVIKELHEKSYKFHGSLHQNAPTGVPVIDNKYSYRVSMRTWGAVMQKAYDLPNEDGLGYVLWAWGAPEGEKNILPLED